MNQTLSSTSGASDSCLYNSRTTLKIVQSCLATLFACIWTSNHPNVPGPKATQLGYEWRQLRFPILVLIVPEFVPAWAIRQFFCARRLWIAKKRVTRGWTLTHSFFAVMGGFWDPVDRRPVVPNFDTEHHIETYLDEYPDVVTVASADKKFINVTQEEIEARGKGDLLAKTLVVIQTAWFVIQCAGRWASHLPVTGLEVMTLAFATLCFVTYALWWYKPLCVHCPVYVRNCSLPLSMWYGSGDSDSQDNGHSPVITNPTLPTTFQSYTQAPGRAESLPGPVSSMPPQKSEEHVLPPMWKIIRGILAYLADGTEKTLYDAFPSESDPERVGWFFWGREKERENSGKDWHRSWDDVLTASAVMMVSVLFGVMHCFAWSFLFPSQTEQVIWRASSLIATCSPPILLILRALRGWMENTMVHEKSKQERHRILAIAGAIYLPLLLSCAALYAIARASLVVVAVTSLRSMPPESYCTVTWASFVPHIE